MKGRIQPNAPCPCGGGKKYKKCHGSPLRAPQTPINQVSPPLFRLHTETILPPEIRTEMIARIREQERQDRSEIAALAWSNLKLPSISRDTNS